MAGRGTSHIYCLFLQKNFSLARLLIANFLRHIRGKIRFFRRFSFCLFFLFIILFFFFCLFLCVCVFFRRFCLFVFVAVTAWVFHNLMEN